MSASLTPEEYRKLIAQGTGVRPARKSKYGNVRTEMDGITFDSKAEATRWTQLQAALRQGIISDLRRQVRYPLTANDEKVADYVADFVYTDTANAQTVDEDVKGVATPIYKLKKKLMKAVHSIEIQEIHATKPTGASKRAPRKTSQ